MEGDDLYLDGNAAAGLLGEIFPFEMSMVQAVCAGCGGMERLGVHPAYVRAPGLVIRCVSCDHPLIRVVRGGGRLWLDLQGVTCLQIEDQALA